MDIIDTLYRLLDRAEQEKDSDAISALHWAIFILENQWKEETNGEETGSRI